MKMAGGEKREKQNVASRIWHADQQAKSPKPKRHVNKA
jgi:hypothetical protein